METEHSFSAELAQLTQLGNQVRASYATYLQGHETLPPELKAELNTFYASVDTLEQDLHAGKQVDAGKLDSFKSTAQGLMMKLSQPDTTDYGYKA